jgi:hypothetical protein
MARIITQGTTLGIEREEFEAWMRVLRSDIHGVHTRLDDLNGRTRKAETEIAVLKDRGDQSKDGHARYAGWGGVIAAAASLLWQFVVHKP